MSKSKFKEIADAIREQEKSQDPIPANEFASRIRGLSGSEDLDTELNTQDELLTNLEETINNFPDNEALVLTNVNEFELPEEFNGSTVYHFILPDGNILFSSINENTGIWLYDNETKTIEQKYTDGYGWQYFQIVGDVCLIGSYHTGGILLYNISTKTVNLAYDSIRMSWRYFHIVGEDCLIGSSGNLTGLLLYDSSNKEIRLIYDSTSYAWQYFKDVEGGCLISSSYSGSKGVLLYDNATKTVEQKYADGYNWQYFQKVNNKCIIGASSSSGLLVYDNLTKTISKKYETGQHYTLFLSFENSCLIASTSTEGILMYDVDTDSITKIYDSGMYWFEVTSTAPNGHYQIMNNICLLGSRSSNAIGVLAYNILTKTISQIYTDGYGWQYFQKIGNNCLINGSYNTSTGILLYNGNTNTIEQIYAEGSYWKEVLVIDNIALLSCNTSSFKGILLYDNDTKTITNIYTKQYRWDILNKVDENTYLVSSSYNSGLLVYDNVTRTITSLISIYATKFYLIGENYYITGDRQSGLYKYNIMSKTVTTEINYGSYYNNVTTINSDDVVMSNEAAYNITKQQLLKAMPSFYLLNNYAYTEHAICDLETGRTKYLSNYYTFGTGIAVHYDKYIIYRAGTKFAVVDCRR